MKRSVSLFDLRPDLRPDRPGDPVVILGDLDLTCSRITHLPDGLSVRGHLDLEHAKISCLPQGLVVGGYLDLSHTPISSLPDGLYVGSSLFLQDTRLTHLPNTLYVGGSLHLRDSRHITCLPEGLYVGGNLFLSGTSISRFPQSMSIEGSIYPSECLEDLIRFRATLTDDVHFCATGMSSHAIAERFRLLVEYPDVLRLIQSFQGRDTWTITPGIRSRAWSMTSVQKLLVYHLKRQKRNFHGFISDLKA